ncbi:MAG TPA: mechanosensitive ion channel family protein [Xanthomonadales bacterium]|nr:mechanosensitive ion channel family protein [Xanthomonadales bacterium]
MAESEAVQQVSIPTERLFDPDIHAWLPDWLVPVWSFMADFPIVLLVLLLILSYGLGKTLQAFFSKGLRKLTSRTPSEFDDRLIEAVNHPVLSTVVILALLVGTSVLRLPEFIHNLTVRLLYTVLLLLWTRSALQVAHLVLEILSRNRHRFTIIQPRTMPAFDMTLKILVIGAALYLFMLAWGINPTAWLASAGVIGIAVGFAAKDTLANFFSGIFIIADAPYKIGDYIVLDTGERGMVKQLGMRSTRLLTRDDIEITIPNAVMGNAKIINESGGPWEKQRIRIPIGVAYGSDADQVMETLNAIALEHPEVIRQPAPRVRLRGFGDSALNFELLAWIDHPQDRGRISHELNMSIYRGFASAGIQIPFPQRDVHVRTMPGPTDT